MNTKRKLVELTIDDAAEQFGVDAISLVKYPAIESNFIFFSKQNKPSQMVTLGTIQEDKRTIIGPALIPDKVIPRIDEKTGEEYDVYFTAATVKQASEWFLRRSFTNNHTFEHQFSIDGVSVVESWLVEDPEHDKSSLYGLSMPKGTWMVRLHVGNDEVWQQVKDGSVQGLSIEGWFTDKMQSLAKPKPTERNLLERILAAVTRRNFYQETALTTGAILATESETFTPGASVFLLDENGQPVGIPDGKYTTDKGSEFEVFDNVIIEWNGKVQKVEESQPEPQAAEPAADLKVQIWKKYLHHRYNLGA